ncbi:hypothetical protein HII31_07135 [Pseudocercospora fuligena]|uniref:Uncharacterized protein n=1 Tax=Pseudocercospora fuligena TaxID=685502 RepID=A0A8H6RIQ9_9PEZI|nr:hypothetical protein HII31_07135 [Pseudocercospora fuligena]
MQNSNGVSICFLTAGTRLIRTFTFRNDQARAPLPYSACDVQALAYVALDNIQVIEGSSRGATPATRTITQFVTQTLTSAPQTQINTQLIPVTGTETISLTTTISGSQIVVTQAVPTIIWSTFENVQTQVSTALVPVTWTGTLTVTTSVSGSKILIKTAVPTVIYSTAIVGNTYTQSLERTATATAVAWTTATVEVPNTRWMNQTATRVDTTTTTVTSTFNITATQDRNAS